MYKTQNEPEIVQESLGIVIRFSTVEKGVNRMGLKSFLMQNSKQK